MARACRLRHDLGVDPISLLGFAGAAAAAAGTAWLVRRFADYGTGRRQLRLAKREPIGRVRRDGKRVKVEGNVSVVGEPLVAPFGGRPCVAYRVQAMLMEDHGPHLLAEETQHVPFALEDETGHARVEEPDILLAIAPVKVLEQAGGGHLHPELRQFLRDRDLTTAMGERVVVVQSTLEPGQRAAVLGRAQLVVDPQRAGGTYRAPGRELRLRALPKGPVIVGGAEG